MPSIQLAYRGLCTRIESADVGELVWLQEFLAPAFARDDAAAADCEVVVRSDAARLAALRGAAPQPATPATALVLDTAPVQVPSWEDGGGRIALDHDGRIAYVIAADRRRIELISANASDPRRTALMKLVRELAMSAAWTAHSLVLHAAAYAVDGRAVLIAGRKRAGKSSLLLHALGAAGARLLANDRVVLALEGERAVAHGMPTIVKLRADTAAARFADEAARRSAYRYRFALTLAEAEQRPLASDLAERPLTCSPAQLARLLDVAMTGQAPAETLLLPRVDPEATGIALRRLDDDAAAHRLADVLFAAVQGSPRISDLFALPGAHAPSLAELQPLWRNAVTHLRVFECRLGPDAYATDPNLAVTAPILA